MADFTEDARHDASPSLEAVQALEAESERSASDTILVRDHATTWRTGQHSAYVFDSGDLAYQRACHPTL